MNGISRLLVVATMGVALTARAEVKVADDVRNDGSSFSGMDYGISERFQRAWLVLHFAEKGPCGSDAGECDIDRPVRVRVPGLTFDPATRRVLFREEGAAPVPCARVVRHRFIVSWESIEATGKCAYRTVKLKSAVDDGFEGREGQRESIYFGVRR
jgi:hypothetical protein